jgi:hypothetical protein
MLPRCFFDEGNLCCIQPLQILHIGTRVAARRAPAVIRRIIMEKRNQSSRDSSTMGGQKSNQSGSSSKQTGQQMKSGQQGSHTSGTRESTAKGGSSHSGNK